MERMSFTLRCLLTLGGAAVAIQSAACQLVFRSAESGTEDAAPIDAADNSVRLFFVTDEVSNNPTFVPISNDVPTDLTGWQIDYVLGDGPKLPAKIDAVAGTATFERSTPTTPYAVWIRAPGQPVQVLFGTSATDYESTTHYGRLKQEIYSLNRFVTLPPSAAANSRLATTGVYANLRVAGCTTPIANWGCAKAVGDETMPPLPSSAHNDRVYLLDYQAASGRLEVFQSADQGLDVERFGTQTFNAPPMAVTPVTTHVKTSAAELCNLQNGVRASSTFVSSWEILSVPLPSRAAGSEVLWPPRGHAIVFPVQPPQACVNFDMPNVVVGNPFPGTDVVLHASSVAVNSFSAGNPAATFFYESKIDVYSKPQGSEWTTPLDGALARNAKFNGNAAPIAALTVAPGPLVVSWETLANEVVDDFVVTVLRLNVPTDGTIVAELRTVNHSLTIPADIVPTGNYVIAITARRGLPAASQQDYRKHAYPMSEGTTVAGQILVQ
jgi:hypothetical protein